MERLQELANKYHYEVLHLDLIGKIITINADDFSFQTDEKLFKEIELFLHS